MYLSEPRPSAATQPNKTKKVTKGRNTYVEAKNNVETRKMKKLKSQNMP